MISVPWVPPSSPLLCFVSTSVGAQEPHRDGTFYNLRSGLESFRSRLGTVLMPKGLLQGLSQRGCKGLDRVWQHRRGVGSRFSGGIGLRPSQVCHNPQGKLTEK